MPTNPDFKGLLSALNAENVEYLVVGAHEVDPAECPAVRLYNQ